MKTGRAATIVAALLLAANPAASSFQQAAEPGQRLTTQATAIVVDVVVRDKQGRPVTDLTASDFELYEDDVRQKIGNLTLVAPDRSPVASPLPGGNAATRLQPAPTATANPTFVALVFDRLSPEARALSHKGALTYLEAGGDLDFAGVFLSDLSLVTVQTFTTDRTQLRKAIDDVASRVTSTFDRLRIGPRGYGDPDPGTPPTAGASSEGPAFLTDPSHTHTVDPGLTPNMNLIAMTSRMERAFEAMSRDQQGHATINSLLAVITGLGELPGRKSVIFFAEALAIPPNVQSQFESVVATANRLNVAVYSVDAAGLRVHSGQSETARRVNSIGSMAMTRDPDRPEGKLTETLELNEDTLRRDPAVSLRLLADRTGGFLIDNTNDLARGFRQIEEDRRFHYLLTYTPAKSDFRGEWRRIAVKIARRNVTVRSRSGYLAVRAPGALPLLSYEGPALAALERSPLPADLPVRAAALVFPQPKARARVAVLVATAAGSLTFDTQRANQTYRTDFTVLARIRDATGEVVRKASQPYRLAGPAAQVEVAKRGDVLFFRQPELEAGSYTLEYVIHDALAKRAGAGSMPLVVQDPRKALQVSSLVIVQRAERVPPNERGEGNPLYYGDLLLYPNLGEPVSKRAAKTVSFYFTVLPTTGGPPATAMLELVQGGNVIGKVSLQLAAPAADGRIQHVSQLPLASLRPGDYELRITVTQAAAVETRPAAFRVVE